MRDEILHTAEEYSIKKQKQTKKKKKGTTTNINSAWSQELICSIDCIVNIRK